MPNEQVVICPYTKNKSAKTFNEHGNRYAESFAGCIAERII
jgi:hypothetical protein